MASRTVLISLILTASTGCATTAARGSSACQPPRGEAGRSAWEELEGEYRLVLIGTSGGALGKRAEGVLRLWPRPEEYRTVLMLDLTPASGTVEPLIGVTNVDVGAVGASVVGSLSSEDSEAPGVLLRVTQGEKSPDLELFFGSEQNRRNTWILDEPILAASIVESGPEGFSGVWHADGGVTTYFAGGHFCAKRVK